jgi:hypothetical protein
MRKLFYLLLIFLPFNILNAQIVHNKGLHDSIISVFKKHLQHMAKDEIYIHRVASYAFNEQIFNYKGQKNISSFLDKIGSRKMVAFVVKGICIGFADVNQSKFYGDFAKISMKGIDSLLYIENIDEFMYVKNGITYSRFYLSYIDNKWIPFWRNYALFNRYANLLRHTYLDKVRNFTNKIEKEQIQQRKNTDYLYGLQEQAIEFAQNTDYYIEIQDTISNSYKLIPTYQLNIVGDDDTVFSDIRYNCELDKGSITLLKVTEYGGKVINKGIVDFNNNSNMHIHDYYYSGDIIFIYDNDFDLSKDWFFIKGLGLAIIENDKTILWTKQIKRKSRMHEYLKKYGFDFFYTGYIESLMDDIFKDFMQE